MANRKQAAPETVERHTVLITEAADDRDHKLKQFEDADENLRVCIRKAFDDGLTAGPIKRASRLSESRLYQIRDGRRH